MSRDPFTDDEGEWQAQDERWRMMDFVSKMTRFRLSHAYALAPTEWGDHMPLGWKDATNSGDPNWGANLELARAQIAFARGEYAVARKHLDAAKPGFSVPNAEAYQVRAVTLLDADLRAKEAGQVIGTVSR